MSPLCGTNGRFKPLVEALLQMKADRNAKNFSAGLTPLDMVGDKHKEWMTNFHGNGGGGGASGGSAAAKEEVEEPVKETEKPKAKPAAAIEKEEVEEEEEKPVVSDKSAKAAKLDKTSWFQGSELMTSESAVEFNVKLSKSNSSNISKKLFDSLNVLQEDNLSNLDLVWRLHCSMHGCCGSSSGLLTSVGSWGSGSMADQMNVGGGRNLLDAVMKKEKDGVLTRDNFQTVMAKLVDVCNAMRGIHWDFALMDGPVGGTRITMERAQQVYGDNQVCTEDGKWFYDGCCLMLLHCILCFGWVSLFGCMLTVVFRHTSHSLFFLFTGLSTFV